MKSTYCSYFKTNESAHYYPLNVSLTYTREYSLNIKQINRHNKSSATAVWFSKSSNFWRRFMIYQANGYFVDHFIWICFFFIFITFLYVLFILFFTYYSSSRNPQWCWRQRRLQKISFNAANIFVNLLCCFEKGLK